MIDRSAVPPSIPVTRSSMPPFETYVERIRPLWDSRWLSNRGELHRELESALTQRFNVPNVALFSNGHLALEATIEAFELAGEVITTPFTFASTSHALRRKGLTPVFSDIREDNFTIDAEAIEALITPRTSAILPVHVYGNLCDVEAIQRIADSYGLKVIYDAAHAFDVSLNGVSAASFGDASMFSFHATKVFHTIEGGAVFSKDPTLIERLYTLQNFGITGPEAVTSVGGNAKLNEFSAAMGLCNLQSISEEIAMRRAVDSIYRSRIGEIPGIYIPPISEGVTHNYPYMPVRIDASTFGASRDEVFDTLKSMGIGARKYFSPIASDFEAYADLPDLNPTPIARKVSAEILALPLYASLTPSQVHFICDAISSCQSEG